MSVKDAAKTGDLTFFYKFLSKKYDHNVCVEKMCLKKVLQFARIAFIYIRSSGSDASFLSFI